MYLIDYIISKINGATDDFILIPIKIFILYIKMFL
jgi:hypothetical protein